ncbi:hypothetical protein [Pseudaminobacter soli (ex Li et al. 2025)]|uniref:DUF680 domain-containing protein n=1 Tax=Pseudaminobacter soli (ex Li et al. 2025) TaxID=1295366 RepID=A0A2P7S7X6_9HYPH|nr:hypothetical protein [Mesorhizobium soli]PSJ58592.1 hypothetical protein C7I85_19605 [Mesorhizobium soli]
MRFLTGAFAIAIGLGLAAPASATINYNASKSNTANLKCHAGRSHMAVKGCGVPQHSTGMATGRRMYKPIQ